IGSQRCQSTCRFCRSDQISELALPPYRAIDDAVSSWPDQALFCLAQVEALAHPAACPGGGFLSYLLSPRSPRHRGGIGAAGNLPCAGDTGSCSIGFSRQTHYKFADSVSPPGTACASTGAV